MLLVPISCLPLTLRNVLFRQRAASIKSDATYEFRGSLCCSPNERSYTAGVMATPFAGCRFARSAAHGFCEECFVVVDTEQSSLFLACLQVEHSLSQPCRFRRGGADRPLFGLPRCPMSATGVAYTAATLSVVGKLCCLHSCPCVPCRHKLLPTKMLLCPR